MIFKNIILNFFLVIFFIYPFDLKANYDCDWKSDSNISCVKITKYINNTSRFNQNTIKKIIITKKDIDQMGAVDLIDVLKYIPGVNIFQSGTRGQQASLFMRGTGSNHVLVMINGVAINDQSTTQGLHDFGVDFIQTIQKLEVYEGPNAVNFGPNAIGGAINIITDSSLKDYVTFSSQNQSNYNFLLNQNYIVNGSNFHNFKIGGVKNKTNSARYLGNEKDGMQNISGNYNFQKSYDNFVISNSLYLRETVANYDGSDTDEYGFIGNNKMISNQLNLSHQKKKIKNEMILYFNQYDREYDEKGILDYYDSNALGVKYNFSNYFENLSYGYGSEYRYDSGEFENNGSYSAYTKGNFDNFSYYTNVGYNFAKNLNLSFFYRNDKNKKTESNKSRKLNLEKKFNFFTLGIGRSQGFRNPTIYELFGTDNYGYSGNKNLKAEKSNSNDLYLDFEILKNLKLSTNIFKSNIYDQIEYSSNRYINRSDNMDLKQSGISSKAAYVNNGYKINLYSSFLSSKKTDGTDQLRIPNKTYGFSILKKINPTYFGEININFNYHHNGKYYDIHSSTFEKIKMDDTNIVDLSFAKKINSNNFHLKFKNLLNENYQKPHGYSQNGRSISLGFTTNY